MRLFEIVEFGRHFLMLHLLIGDFAIIETTSEANTRDKKISFVDESFDYSETTTSPSAINVVNDRKLTTSPIVAISRNDTDVFKPSVHLGEIDQPRTRTNPFNNVQHVRFDNNVQLLDTRFQEDGIVQDARHSEVPNESTRPNRIRFEDDDSSAPVRTPSVHHDDGQRVVTESSGSRLEDTTSARQAVYVDQTLLQNVGVKPTETQDTIFGKLTSDHRLTVHPMVDYMVDYVSRSPYVIGYYTTGDQGGAHRPQEIAFEMTKKPEGNDVIMVQQQESIYTRKHKFPYQFYQPGGENHNVQYAEEPRYHPRTRRTSPWKKIIHLIGTFLPLGLLLATLTPNVVRVNSTTTQPPIVLSKLRSADLPVEHKHARLLESAVCEDRSVCEMILAGGEPQSNILQNILWNLATRTPDNIAERNGLGEIFDAVKKKNCVIISC